MQVNVVFIFQKECYKGLNMTDRIHKTIPVGRPAWRALNPHHYFGVGANAPRRAVSNRRAAETI